jgi:protease I
MTNELSGKRIAFLVANEGVEQVELTQPWEAVRAAGGLPVLVAPESGTVQAFNHLDKGDTFPVDLQTSEAVPEDFDGVVLPGGVANPDQLRLDAAAVSFVRSWTELGNPVAAICHGPWTLIEAGVLEGKQLASWPSLRTDLQNAGAIWLDEQVVRCDERGWTLISSRKPEDLDAFDRELIAAFSE